LDHDGFAVGGEIAVCNDDPFGRDVLPDVNWKKQGSLGEIFT